MSFKISTCLVRTSISCRVGDKSSACSANVSLHSLPNFATHRTRFLFNVECFRTFLRNFKEQLQRTGANSFFSINFELPGAEAAGSGAAGADARGAREAASSTRIARSFLASAPDSGRLAPAVKRKRWNFLPICLSFFFELKNVATCTFAVFATCPTLSTNSPGLAWHTHWTPLGCAFGQAHPSMWAGSGRGGAGFIFFWGCLARRYVLVMTTCRSLPASLLKFSFSLYLP